MQSETWDAYGYRIRFEMELPEHQPIVRAVVLPDWIKVDEQTFDCLYRVGGADDVLHVTFQGDEIINGYNYWSGEDALRRHCQLHLASYCSRYVFVHAGVVKTDLGLILIVGCTWSGKSQLVDSFLKYGSTYFSDEYALLDSNGMVHPFPRPVRVRTSPIHYRFTPAADLGWRPDQHAERPRCIIFTHYKEGTEWEPRRLSTGEALLKLFESTVSASLTPERDLLTLKACLDHNPICLHGPRGEAEALIERLPDLMRV